MSKNKKKINNQSFNEESVVEVELEKSSDSTDLATIPEIFRVRLDWYNRESQTYAGTSYDSALEECMKHEGYKIYIGDEGKLFKDPWEEIKQKPVEPKEEEPYKSIIQVYKGKVIKLENEPVYKDFEDKAVMIRLTGRFYFYDNTITNGRAKITTNPDVYKPDPKYILGYIKVRDEGMMSYV